MQNRRELLLELGPTFQNPRNQSADQIFTEFLTGAQHGSSYSARFNGTYMEVSVSGTDADFVRIKNWIHDKRQIPCHEVNLTTAGA